MADFNGDGLPDIFMVADTNTTNNMPPTLLLNTGGGNFKPNTIPFVMQTGSNWGSFDAAIADFNSDGHPDVALLNGGSFGGIYNVIAIGDGKGGFTRGPNLPIITSLDGGSGGTIEASAAIDLNEDGNTDLIVWIVDRTNAALSAKGIVPSHLAVWINKGDSSFTDETAQWLGNFATTNIGNNPPALQMAYIPGTKLIPINIEIAPFISPQDGGSFEPTFLYNNGKQLIPIFDQYWNNQIPPLGYTGYNDSLNWINIGNNIEGVYRDWQGNLVEVTFNPSVESSLIVPHDPFLVIDRDTLKVIINDGIPFSNGTISNLTPSYIANATRELILVTPANNILVGSSANSYISSAITETADGGDVFIGNGYSDFLMGGVGDDIFLPSRTGQSYVDGRDGADTVILRGARSQYSIQSKSDGSIEVSGNGVDDIFRNIEKLKFTDQTWDVTSSTPSASTAVNGFVLLTSSSHLGPVANSLYVGSTGAESLAFSGSLNQYNVTNSNGVITVSDLVANRDGAVLLYHVGAIKLSDFSINTTMKAEAAKLPTATVNSIVELYVAYFARTPDATGLSYWIDKAAAGETLTAISKEFYNAGVQFSSLTGYSATMANSDFIKIVYTNVLGRSGATAPPDADVAYWDNQIKIGATTKEGLIQTMLTAAHSFANDPTWGWVPKLLDNKISVGYQAAVTYGLDYNSSSDAITQGMAIAHAVTSTDTSAAVGLIGVTGHVFL